MMWKIFPYLLMLITFLPDCQYIGEWRPLGTTVLYAEGSLVTHIVHCLSGGIKFISYYDNTVTSSINVQSHSR